MDEEDRSSGAWDGEERRRNPLRRLIFAREVRDMMRELGTGEGRFRRPGEEDPEDDPPGPDAPGK